MHLSRCVPSFAHKCLFKNDMPSNSGNTSKFNNIPIDAVEALQFMQRRQVSSRSNQSQFLAE